MNKKFTLEELSNIRPGDLVLYDYFWVGNEEWHKVLKVAVRYGLNKDGILNSEDDYLIVEDDKTVDEVDYKDILDIRKQDTKQHNILEEDNSFDKRWEKEFSSDEGTNVMSVDEFFEEFERMKDFNL